MSHQSSVGDKQSEFFQQFESQEDPRDLFQKELDLASQVNTQNSPLRKKVKKRYGKKREELDDRVIDATQLKKTKKINKLRKDPQKQSKAKNQQRIDQNMCKKYHKAAQNSLKNVPNLQELKEDIKKHNIKEYTLSYFPSLLMIASIFSSIDDFQEQYKKQIIKVLWKHKIKQKSEKLKDLQYFIQRSVQSIKVYKKEGPKACCEFLYSQKVHRRSTYRKAINNFMSLVEVCIVGIRIILDPRYSLFSLQDEPKKGKNFQFSTLRLFMETYKQSKYFSSILSLVYFFLLFYPISIFLQAIQNYSEVS